MNSFKHYYFQTIIRPRRTFDALVVDPRRLRYGIGALAIMAVLYTFVYIFLIFGGGQPFKPWLAIPDEVYYRYNVFFVAPSMFMAWILAAGVTQLLGHLFAGQGSFEDTLSVLGFGIGIASWSTAIHDLLTSFLGAVHIIDQREYEHILNSPTLWRTLLWIQFAIYLLWFLLLFSKGIGAAQRLRRGPAIFLGVIAFVIYQFVFLIFNR